MQSFVFFGRQDIDKGVFFHTFMSDFKAVGMIREILLVGAGGFAGSVCRYLVSLGIATLSLSTSFPVSTMTVNFVGSLLIGFFMSVTSHNWLIFLGIMGFCGGFTTFSTFSSELLAMIKASEWIMAAGYALLSVVICVAAVAIGLWLGKTLI